MNDQAMDYVEDENNISSDSSNDEEDEKREQLCKELEEQLTNNKFLYDHHVELVGLYELSGDLNSLRSAYQRFHECFPLTPELWLKWIKNEIKVAVSEQEKQAIFNLFEKAVEDYLSVNLWQEYAQYAMDVSDLNNTKKVLEKAVNSAGLHVSDGSLLWDFLREIELASLSLTEPNTEGWKEQVAKVSDTFRRQLSVPLLGMENTYNEWKQWLETLPKDFKIDQQPAEWGYQKASKLLDSFKPFEDELLATDDQNEMYEIYKQYIATVNDPSSVLCLYERAVAGSCLNPTIWLDYCNYTFKLGDIALKTCDRALRNCPWSEDLWVFKIRILEHTNQKNSDVLSAFEQGIESISPQPGVQLWFAYIEYVKRNSDDEEKLKKLLETASQQLSDYDQNSSMERFQARILAKTGEIKDAITIWNKILNKQHNKGNLAIWIDFINMVRQFGDGNQTRTSYQRALNSCKDYAYYIADQWLLFERECGTLETVLKCIEKCKTITQIEPIVEPTHNETPQESSKKTNRKRPREPEVTVEVKRVKKEIEKEPVKPKKPIEKDPKKTVFLSNISIKVDERDLEKMFPNAENIELCRDRKGKSKCFAYVQFSLEEEVMTALARDREPLEGRPVFISNCKPDKNERQPAFKYSTTLEENKLFVKGLPKTHSKEDIMKIFEPFGALEVRVVMQKSGQSKGLAYVEFADTEAAKKALVQTDQKEIGGHVITVAISAPPPKKAHDEKLIEPISHPKSRLNVPLIPRSIQTKSLTNVEENGKKVSKSNDDFRKMLLNK